MADANTIVENLMKFDSSIAAMIVDSDTGMVLAAKASKGFDPELAAAGNTRVIQAQRDTMNLLDIDGEIHDVLITLDAQLHIIHPVPEHREIFGYLIVSKSAGMNLALARSLLKKEMKSFVFDG